MHFASQHSHEGSGAYTGSPLPTLFTRQHGSCCSAIAVRLAWHAIIRPWQAQRILWVLRSWFLPGRHKSRSVPSLLQYGLSWLDIS